MRQRSKRCSKCNARGPWSSPIAERALRRLTFDMSGGPKGAKRPLERPLDGGVRRVPRGNCGECGNQACVKQLDHSRHSLEPLVAPASGGDLLRREKYATRPFVTGPALVHLTAGTSLGGRVNWIFRLVDFGGVLLVAKLQRGWIGFTNPRR